LGIRETLNRKPAITTAATLIIIVVMLGVIVYQSWDFQRTPPPQSMRAWFTVDDGRNWFPDDAGKLPPWDYEGKPVYRVFVFTCDGGKSTFPGYLQRYTPDALRKLSEQQNSGTHDSSLDELLAGPGVEIKPPLTGDKGWMKRNDPQAGALLEPMCKGTNEPAARVEP
jgi:hypothetical protein